MKFISTLLTVSGLFLAASALPQPDATLQTRAVLKGKCTPNTGAGGHGICSFRQTINRVQSAQTRDCPAAHACTPDPQGGSYNDCNYDTATGVTLCI